VFSPIQVSFVLHFRAVFVAVGAALLRQKVQKLTYNGGMREVMFELTVVTVKLLSCSFQIL
jgi:hypothetical protein